MTTKGVTFRSPLYPLKEEDDHTKHTAVDLTNTLIRGSGYAMRCFQNTPQVKFVIMAQKSRALIRGSALPHR